MTKIILKSCISSNFFRVSKYEKIQELIKGGQLKKKNDPSFHWNIEKEPEGLRDSVKSFLAN